MSSHSGHLQQIKYKLIIIVTMLECKTVTLRTRPLKHGMLSFYLDYYPGYLNPEKPDVPLNKNDAFQKVQKRHVQEKR